MLFLSALEEIDKHFEDVDSAIKEYFQRNRPEWGDCQFDEIKNLRGLRLLENERAISFTLLAALESWFRRDCEVRAKAREKSPIGRRFKKIYAASGRSIKRVKFDDILNAWSDLDLTTKQIIGVIRGAFKYRHWLAHGRYWTLKLGRKYDFDTLYNIAQNAATLLMS